MLIEFHHSQIKSRGEIQLALTNHLRKQSRKSEKEREGEWSGVEPVLDIPQRRRRKSRKSSAVVTNSVEHRCIHLA